MQASRNGVAVAPPQHWATFMEDEGVELREQVPLAPYTTFGLGGKARYFVECGSEDEARAALAYAAERRLPAYVLGGGSNVVFLDSGFPGLILRLTIGGIELRDGPSPEVCAGAGVDWDTLVQNVVQRGWTGVECLSGIPGTVGGTPIQNVGAYGQEIAESLVSVECLDRTALGRLVLHQSGAVGPRLRRPRAALEGDPVVPGGWGREGPGRMARRARRVSQGIPERGRRRGGDLDPSRAGAGESRRHERGSA